MSFDDTHSGFPFGHVTDHPALAVDYLDGLLDSDQRAGIEAHLEHCVACRDSLRVQRDTAALTRGMGMETPPTELAVRVFASLAAEQKAESFAHRTGSVRSRHTGGFWSRLGRVGQPRYLAAAAAVTAALVVAAVGLTGNRDDLTQSVSETEAGRTIAVTTTFAGFEASDDQPVSESTPGGSGVPGKTADAPLTATTAPSDTSTTPSTAPPTSATTDSRADKIALLVDSPVIEAPDDSQVIWVSVRDSEERRGDIAAFFEEVTGLAALPDYYWLGGPTYAVVASPAHLEKLIEALIDSGLYVQYTDQPVDPYGNALPGLKAGILTYKQMLPADDVVPGQPNEMGEEPPSLVVFIVPLGATSAAE